MTVSIWRLIAFSAAVAVLALQAVLLSSCDPDLMEPVPSYAAPAR